MNEPGKMTMTIAGVLRAARRSSQRIGFYLIVLMAMAFAPSLYAQSQNVLSDISFAPRSGGKVQITLKMSAATPDPRVFATENPPRIAIDIPDTQLAVTQRRIEVNSGATAAINAAEAGGRTRVVVDLFRPSTYETRREGNDLIVTVSGGVTASAAAASVVQGDPTKTNGVAQLEITNIDFHRGKNGEGRIIISFSGQGVNADLVRKGNDVSLDIYNARLPTQLAQKLDVLDFATPVQYVETHSKGGGAHLDILAKPPFEQLAYQSGNQYIVEVLPAKEKEKVDPNAPPVYVGNRVTFNMQDIPVRTALQLIAEISDLNIVVADSVAGNLTLRLNNVPWDQALDLVLQAKGLDKRRNGNTIWVAPQKEIAEREQSIADAQLKLEEVSQTVTEYIPISYGKAKDIADLLTQKSQQANGGSQASGSTTAASNSGLLSSRGRVSADVRTNTLIISDTPDKVKTIRELVTKLDKPVQQVLIEARIVIATDNFARQIGAQFGISAAAKSGSNIVTTSGSLNGAQYMAGQAFSNRLTTGSPYPITPPGFGSGSSSGSSGTSSILGDQLNVSLPVTGSALAGGIGVSILTGSELIDLALTAGQTEGKSQLISSPRVITASQKEADVMQGQQIPYSTISGGTTGAAIPTVSFVEAVLELKVTPTITADGRVFLELDVKKDALDSYYHNASGDYPIINKKEVSTAILIDNGQTVVLGGVYEFDKLDSVTKVPFLGDIPGLGVFFRNTQKSNQKSEMLIFITPKILDENLR